MIAFKKIFRLVEFLFLFVLLPVLLALPVYKWIKYTLVALGLLYVAYFSIKNKSLMFPKKVYSASKVYKLRVVVVSLLLLVLGIGFLQYYNSSLLFKIVIEKPFLWVIILFVYTFLSVLPQELVYRRFFYIRYHHLIKNSSVLYVTNVICFSLCHLFLKSIPVLVITCIGGCFFAYTYEKERSLKWVVLEHAIYGNLVFTLGLGEMLAFPS